MVSGFCSVARVFRAEQHTGMTVARQNSHAAGRSDRPISVFDEIGICLTFCTLKGYRARPKRGLKFNMHDACIEISPVHRQD